MKKTYVGKNMVKPIIKIIGKTYEYKQYFMMVDYGLTPHIDKHCFHLINNHI